MNALGAHWPALSALCALFATGALVRAWRRHQRALARREELVLLPTESFDPSPEEVRRWAAALGQTRRPRDWSRRRAEAIRFTLRAEEGGLVRQRLAGSHRALALLEPALPHQVELHRPEPQAEAQQAPGGAPRPKAGDDSTEERSAERPPVFRARAELVITPGQAHALAALDLKPDPLSPLVAALADLRDGETASVALDLQPLSRARRRSELAKARRRDKSRPDWTTALTSGQWLNDDPLARSSGPKTTASASSKGALARLESRSETVTDHDRFAVGEPVFAAQLLVWADAPDIRRARQLVATLIAGLGPMEGRAAWRRTGFHLGPLHVGGADSPSLRRRFDHRARAGCFHPARSSIVGAAEVAGLIKPPTVHCHAPNVVRGGGMVPAPPAGLLDWAPGTPGVFPYGEITERGVKRWVGGAMSDTLFSASFGRSGWGKTEKALVAAIALANEPDAPGSRAALRRPGVLYLDPHGDALERMMPYLVGHADRVLEVNLSRDATATQAGWNPLDMTGCSLVDVEARVSMMAAAFAATLGWTEKNNRGLNLISQATASLCELGLQLPPGVQPTIFQVITILADKGWREEVLHFLSPHSRSFWETRFAHQTSGMEAITPVTNLLDRLRASAHVAALFGQPRSTFNMRQAMDAGRIVLLCPGGAEDKEQLILALFLFELFRATASRRDTPPEDRRPVHAFVDELQVADKGEASELIARMLREGRKFGLRFHAMVQEPLSLTKLTLGAISTNRSHLFTTAINHQSASWLIHEFADRVEPRTLTTIEQYHAVASVNHGGRPSPPFRLRGLSVPEAWGPPADAEAVAALERAVDVSMGRQSVADVLRNLDTLDGRILAHLRGAPEPRSSEAGPPARRRRQPVAAPVALPPGVASIDRARGKRPRLSE